MTETPCQAVKMTGQCPCPDYVPVLIIGRYECCARCTHNKETHREMPAPKNPPPVKPPPPAPQPESPVVQLPHGDPVYAVYVWRQDSITLARVRPILEKIVVLADAPCLTPVGGEACLVLSRMGTPDDPPYCLACQLKIIRTELYGQPRKEHA